MEVDQETAYERLLEAGYREEQIAAILGLGSLDSELSEIRKQQEYADRLRHPASPEGRRAGNVYVAANPLEHIGTTMQHIGAEDSTARRQARQQQIWNEQMRRRMEYLKNSGKAVPAPTGAAAVPGAPGTRFAV